MSRKLFGPGARGEIVKRIQQALAANGVEMQATDGVYGRETSQAVGAFQHAKSLPVTGDVDETTWQLLTARSVPSSFERSLQLTARFEGHQFTLARGNFDGAWLTWGIIGFTMKSGNVPRIIRDVNASSPQSVTQAFGNNAGEILNIADAPPEEQRSWAQTRTLPNGDLAEPWRGMFAAFGADPAVQREQLARVQAGYMDPALKTASGLGLKTELGLALCFDIHVQNGGIHANTRAMIEKGRSANGSDLDLRRLIAKAVADTCLDRFRADVLSRKTTIATGQGTVHGAQFVLENWGLGEYEADVLLVR
jgi:hypothetical protein